MLGNLDNLDFKGLEILGAQLLFLEHRLEERQNDQEKVFQLNVLFKSTISKFTLGAKDTSHIIFTLALLFKAVTLL